MRVKGRLTVFERAIMEPVNPRPMKQGLQTLTSAQVSFATFHKSSYARIY